MADDSPIAQQRRHLHAAVSELPAMDDQLPDAAFLVGWVLTAEFADPDGSRWFCSRSGSYGGESDLYPWSAKGYLHHVLDEGMLDGGRADDGED